MAGRGQRSRSIRLLPLRGPHERNFGRVALRAACSSSWQSHSGASSSTMARSRRPATVCRSQPSMIASTCSGASDFGTPERRQLTTGRCGALPVRSGTQQSAAQLLCPAGDCPREARRDRAWLGEVDNPLGGEDRRTDEPEDRAHRRRSTSPAGDGADIRGSRGRGDRDTRNRGSDRGSPGARARSGWRHGKSRSPRGQREPPRDLAGEDFLAHRTDLHGGKRVQRPAARCRSC